MGQVLIRNLDDQVIESLKAKAKLKGKSFEQELRDLLTQAAPMTVDERIAVSERLCSAFAVEDFDSRAAIRWGRDDEFFEIEQKAGLG